MAAVFGSSANPHQLQAIQATDGPVLIIAGPGSGKTFTLVERIIYLITHKGLSPGARQGSCRLSHAANG
jgi:DNA helicase-2/ATP-dependent DNA helicase PcrA